MAADLLEFCFKAIDSLPYSTAAELQAAEKLTSSSDAYPTITLPSGQYSASDLSKLQK